MRNNLIQNLRLCFVTNLKGDYANYAKIIQLSVLGGVTMVQLREKHQNIDNIRTKALFVQSILRPLGVPLIINDFVELAAEIGADGVHLGQTDMDVIEARKLLGPDKIIGVSIESHADLHKANQQPDISYVTASAVFLSRTKPNCKTIWGLDNLRQLAAESYHPITAIGGIKQHNAADVFAAGACGIAVIGAIQDAADPYRAAFELSACAKEYQSPNSIMYGR